MQQIDTIEFGSTGLRVSNLCLGTMYFVDDAASFPLLDCYSEAGGTFIDTANVYGKHVPGHFGGESEALIGRWMADRNNRQKLFLATKVGVTYPQDAGTIVAKGISRAQLIRECEKSLARMRTDVIDLYYLHNDFRETPFEEVFATLGELKRAGKIRFVGASSHPAWRMEQGRLAAMGLVADSFCCVQERHTYLRPRPGAVFSGSRYLTEEIQDWCATHRIALLAYSPLLKGAYFRDDRELPPQYRSSSNMSRLKVLREVARELEATPNQVVLAWLLRSSPSVIPLITGSRVEQLRENIGASRLTLDAACMARLDAAGE